MATQKDYLQQAQAMLPQGPAWTRNPGATLTRVLMVFAQNAYSVSARGERLVWEANPANSLELLPDWERVTGLPDECAKCIDTPKTVEERRDYLVSHLRGNAEPTPAYFESLGAQLGYEITVTELKPFICGLSRCGDRLNGPATVRYNAVTVIIKGDRVAWFRTGSARCGDRLGTIRYAAELECLLNKLKPAHVNFIYSYE